MGKREKRETSSSDYPKIKLIIFSDALYPKRSTDMEYLNSLVTNYSITVPFALKKLGERNLSDEDIEKMKNFTLLCEFRRKYLDITEIWETIQQRPLGGFLFIFFGDYAEYDHNSFRFGGISSFKEYMISHRNEIYKVFMVHKNKMEDYELIKIRKLLMQQS